jgi:multiple sugar transport system ATP-binding protein
VAEIELRNVTKRFGAATAVRDTSLTIHDGEFFILVGPSGCGKSTLLNLIVGLEELTDGEIRLDGERIDDLDPKDRNMAMVFQSYAIYPHMSVRENLAFPLKLAGLDKPAIERRVAQAAGRLGLEALLDRKPGALSGGQRQRVAMGRALVREPKVFLLDEPLSNLDAQLRVQMRAELARLQRTLGTTTVYVTHDQTEAMTLGDRIAVLRGGEVLQTGTPRELYEQPGHLFVAGFIGSPAMNFLPARVSRGALELPLGSCRLPDGVAESVQATPGSLVAGFRPEHLRLAEGRDGLCFEARAEVVEWLGSDLYVYFDVALADFAPFGLAGENGAGARNSRTLVARIDPAAGLKTGDRITLCVDVARVHLFDAGSGINLSLAGTRRK